jgi:hypothetical protein
VRVVERSPNQGDDCAANVDYYRCPLCGHVWTVNRETGQFIEHVTRRQPDCASLSNFPLHGFDVLA